MHYRYKHVVTEESNHKNALYYFIYYELILSSLQLDVIYEHQFKRG